MKPLWVYYYLSPPGINDVNGGRAPSLKRIKKYSFSANHIGYEYALLSAWITTDYKQTQIFQNQDIMWYNFAQYNWWRVAMSYHNQYLGWSWMYGLPNFYWTYHKWLLRCWPKISCCSIYCSKHWYHQFHSTSKENKCNKCLFNFPKFAHRSSSIALPP